MNLINFALTTQELSLIIYFYQTVFTFDFIQIILIFVILNLTLEFSNHDIKFAINLITFYCFTII